MKSYSMIRLHMCCWSCLVQLTACLMKQLADLSKQIHNSITIPVLGQSLRRHQASPTAPGPNASLTAANAERNDTESHQ